MLYTLYIFIMLHYTRRYSSYFTIRVCYKILPFYYTSMLQNTRPNVLHIIHIDYTALHYSIFILLHYIHHILLYEYVTKYSTERCARHIYSVYCTTLLHMHSIALRQSVTKYSTQCSTHYIHSVYYTALH